VQEVNYPSTGIRHRYTIYHTGTIPIFTVDTPTLVQTQHLLHVHNTDTNIPIQIYSLRNYTIYMNKIQSPVEAGKLRKEAITLA